MEPPNKGHFKTTLFALYKEVVLFERLKIY